LQKGSLLALYSRLFYFKIDVNTIQASTILLPSSPVLFNSSTHMMANNTNNAINKNDSIKINRALTYSEMMNEGIQSMTSGKQEQVDGLQERMQILDKKQNTFKT